MKKNHTKSSNILQFSPFFCSFVSQCLFLRFNYKSGTNIFIVVLRGPFYLKSIKKNSLLMNFNLMVYSNFVFRHFCALHSINHIILIALNLLRMYSMHTKYQWKVYLITMTNYQLKKSVSSYRWKLWALYELSKLFKISFIDKIR